MDGYIYGPLSGIFIMFLLCAICCCARRRRLQGVVLSGKCKQYSF